ncbi:MAG: phosphatidylserine decarboxylase [Micrococcaceae bacterium]
MEEKQSGPGHIFKLVKDSLPPINKGGYPFIAASAMAGLAARSFSKKLGPVGLLATGAIALFFREPQRVTPERHDSIFACADGEVALIEKAIPPTELNYSNKPLTRISTFLTVLDVHVQRAPLTGKILKVEYHPGRFLSADLDKASEENERNTVIFQSHEGHDIIVTQIAGLVARRIVCQVTEGEEINAGDTYGLIRFGSRVDVYLPEGALPEVVVGQRTIGGETVLAKFNHD